MDSGKQVGKLVGILEVRYEKGHQKVVWSEIGSAFGEPTNSELYPLQLSYTSELFKQSESIWKLDDRSGRKATGKYIKIIF